MAVIGAINLLLSAKTDQFTKDLKKGANSVTSFAGSVLGLNKVFAGVVASFDVGSTLTAIPNQLKAVAESIREIGKQATSLGTTTDQLSKLQYIARQTGTDASTLTGSLDTLQTSLQEAASNAGGPAAAAFKALGLDVNQLVQEDPASAYLKIAGAISKVGTYTEKSAAATAIFGASGKQMLGTLSAGPATLDSLSERFKKLGGNISELDRINVDKAFRSFDDLSTIIQGIGIQIVSQLAPYITSVTQAFADWASGSTNGADLVSGALQGVTTAIAFVADGLELVNLTWKGLKVAATVSLSTIVKMLGFAAKGVDKLVKAFGSAGTGASEFFNTLSSELDKTANEQIGDFAKAFTGQSWGDKVKQTFQAVETGAKQSATAIEQATNKTQGLASAFGIVGTKIADLNKSLKEQLGTFNMSSAQVELYKLKLAGAKDEQLKLTKALLKRTNSLEVMKEFATPVEQAQLKIAALRKQLSEGLLDQSAFERATARIGTDLFGESLTKRAGAMELGSKEARSTILEYAGKASADPTRDTARTSKQMLITLDKWLPNLKYLGAMNAQANEPIPAEF